MKKSAVTMTALTLFLALAPVGAATAEPGDHPKMKHSAAVDKALRGAAEKAAPSTAASALAVADVTATVQDPTGDTDPTLEPRADITAGSLSFGEGGPNVTVTVPGGTNPGTDPNWNNPTSFVAWLIDTNNDAAKPEYVIEAFNEGGAFVGAVFTAEGDFTCDAAAEFITTGPQYAVSFDPSCIGNPGAARFLTLFVYDTTPDPDTGEFFDVAPNVGLSPAARNDFATAKPAARLGATWYLRNTLSGGPADFTFGYGRADDFPLMCDWNGDGLKTPGVVRGNRWFLRNSNSGGGASSFSYGTATDYPVCGDWNNDGIDTVGVVRGKSWFLRNANSTGTANVSFTYGRADDFPVVGDWNGDGRTTIGVVRGKSWFLRNANSTGTANVSFTYGRADDFPIVGDWDADAQLTETIGVVRGRNWLLRNSNSGGSAQISFTYGPAGAVPLVWR